MKNVEHNYEKYKEYYTNIRQIELLTGEKFSLYQNCSEQAYYASCKLVAYLKHEPVIIKSPGGVEISAEATVFSDFTNSDCKKEEMAAISTSADIVLELNDKTYKIPYMHSIFSPCKVMKMERKNKDTINIKFKYEADQYYALYSDKSTLEEFPKVK